tara:strand:- start:258 stop:455 length:198 start_codon:yes stop_codon:yes gene_type:complete
MGGVFKPKAPPAPKVDPMVEEAKKAEEARRAALEEQQRTYSEKRAKGIIGSRSLFARPGGRGFFG